MEKQDIIFTNELPRDLSEVLGRTDFDKLFILTDETTLKLCEPRLRECAAADGQIITIGATDANKTIESLTQVWMALSKGGATRKSLLINLGGGMVTDLGGFAASTFKRGIPFVNIPTTLLAMVDASVGGKTGINFNHLKNEIGVFQNALTVLVDTTFLQTLDDKNVCSGYAEMLKHGLISDRDHWARLMNFDLQNPDLKILQELVRRSVEVKENIVLQDPHEHGIRKALNFGHTLGHAFESLALEQNHPVLHGYAVAWGMVGELYLSCKRQGFPHDVMFQTVQFIKEHYGVFAFDCKRYERIYELMTHDKKNAGGSINTTLLGGIGDIKINQTTGKDEVFEMLDFYRETMGC